MEEITSITITKIAENLWKYHDNTMNSDDGGSDNYSGTWYGNLVTIKTKTGQPIYNRQPYTLFTYVDSLDSGNNFTPSSASGLIAQLKQLGFFGSSSGGGEGGATTFLQLLDTFNNYFGRAGQAVVVNEDETALVTQELSVVQALQDLNNWLGGATLSPNQYLVTSSITDEGGNAIGFGQASVQNIINRPTRFTEVQIINKGYLWIEGAVVGNEEDVITEVGDTARAFLYDDVNDRMYFYPAMRWKGGSMEDINNWVFGHRVRLYFDTDDDAGGARNEFTDIRLIIEPEVDSDTDDIAVLSFDGTLKKTSKAAIIAAASAGAIQNLQEVTEEGSVTDISLTVQDTVTDGKTEYLYNGTRYSADGLSITEVREAPIADITITDPAKPANDTRAYLSDVIAPFGFPLTKKSQGTTTGVPHTGYELQVNDACFGSAMITDPITGETIEADIIDAVYNGPDPESQGSYTINYFRKKNG